MVLTGSHLIQIVIKKCVIIWIWQIINEPTRPNLKEINSIDLNLCNRSKNITAFGVFSLGISDHCPLASETLTWKHLALRLLSKGILNNSTRRLFSMSHIHQHVKYQIWIWLSTILQSPFCRPSINTHPLKSFGLKSDQGSERGRDLLLPS